MTETIQTYGSFARVGISGFGGISQEGGGIGGSVGAAFTLVNGDVDGGILKPFAADEIASETLEKPIGTLALLSRRWYAADNEKDVLVAASGGHLYWSTLAGDEWHAVELSTSLGQDRFLSDEWSCVTYEKNPEGSQSPIDVLILSNAKDGMIVLRGDDLTVERVETPKKFACIARHAERIWGCGVTDEPDLLMYSAPFDPFDWTQNDETPEDGAGEVMLPSWDGDRFTALVPFGSTLLAFKRHSLWRLTGSNPSEFVIRRQFGEGVPARASVVEIGTRLMGLHRDGVWTYDGESVRTFESTRIREILSRVTSKAADSACACVYRSRCYFAFPVDGAERGCVLIYDTETDAWMLRTGLRIRAFLPTDKGLYFVPDARPAKLLRLTENGGTALPLLFVGRWLDLGMKERIKRGFTLYLTVECEEDVALRIGVETERHLRMREIVFRPDDAQRRIRLSGSGRRFRLRIEAPAGAMYAISGGMQLETELEAD